MEEGHRTRDARGSFGGIHAVPPPWQGTQLCAAPCPRLPLRYLRKCWHLDRINTASASLLTPLPLACRRVFFWSSPPPPGKEILGEGSDPGTPRPMSSSRATGYCLLPPPDSGGTAATHQGLFPVGNLNSALLELCVSPCVPSPLNSCKPEFSHSVWRDRCLLSIKPQIFWALAYRPGEGEFFSSTFEGQNQKGTSITAEVRRSLALFCVLCPSVQAMSRSGSTGMVTGKLWQGRSGGSGAEPQERGKTPG